jgi:YidC/Oxa1 family membrane protein insertase
MNPLPAITKVMATILLSILSVTHNMGVTLLLFAFFVKLITAGPTQKMLKSQRDMARIKPLLSELDKLHKDDAVKKQQETMRIMKEQGVDPPIVGCLLMLVQMPILLGIYRAITSHPEQFSSAYFLWMHPGTLQSLFPKLFASCLANRDLPLVIIYGVMMLLSQSTTPSQAEGSQKTMGLYMSMMFTYMVWKFEWPCALVIYWSCYQFFTIMHQMYYTKHLDRLAAARATP